MLGWLLGSSVGNLVNVNASNEAERERRAVNTTRRTGLRFSEAKREGEAEEVGRTTRLAREVKRGGRGKTGGGAGRQTPQQWLSVGLSRGLLPPPTEGARMTKNNDRNFGKNTEKIISGISKTVAELLRRPSDSTGQSASPTEIA
jgi:hypothetical protein